LALTPPHPIGADGDLSQFDCGEEALNDWLRRYALKSEGVSARSYVVKHQGVVVGYYCLATGAVARSDVPGKMRHGLPDLIPVMVLGRLATDKTYQGRGIGSFLLKDALLRTLQVSAQVGIRALLVHAIDDRAAAFYAGVGFKALPAGSRTLLLPIESLGKAL
jgi:GNAT superfamily N-acetyltransferase